MVNYITEFNEAFFAGAKKVLKNYEEIEEIKIVGSILRNKDINISDIDFSVTVRNISPDLNKIKNDILKLHHKDYPRFDVFFFRGTTYEDNLLFLKKNNFSAYKELIKHPYLTISNNKNYNFEYGKKYNNYSKTPFMSFMSKIALTAN